MNNDYDWFNEIQDLKNSQKCLKKGINYANVVAIYLYDRTIIGILKKIVFSLFFTTTLKTNGTTTDLVFFYSARYKKRRDYDKNIEMLYAITNQPKVFIESTEKFSAKQIFFTFKYFSSSMAMLRDFQPGFIWRVSVAMLIAKYQSTAVKLDIYLKNAKILITFCDAHPADNLVTQIAKTKKVKTYTSQHGQYRILTNENISVDAEAYANFISDYMFCWGDATINEFSKIGISHNRFIKTGWIREWDARIINLLNNKKNSMTFGVMLNGENSKAFNTALIEAAKVISNEFGMKYIVRLHPANKSEDYLSYINDRCISISRFTLFDYLGIVDFSIAHMSAATIEILHVGGIVYLLDDGKLANVFCLEGLSYPSVEQIINAIYNDTRSKFSNKDRLERIANWFNDDREQRAKILETLMD